MHTCKMFVLVAASFVITSLTVFPTSTILAGEKASPTITVGGGPVIISRSDFQLIQPLNERFRGPDTFAGEPFEYQTEGPAGFHNATIEWPLFGNLALALSFQGIYSERSQDRPIPGGSSAPQNGLADNTSVLPLLNNHGMGRATPAGAAVEIGAKPNDFNATADTRFEYDSQQYDTAMDLIWKDIYVLKDIHLDGLMGMGYTRINQNFDLHTTGVNVINLGTATTNTGELLRENMLGGRVGLQSRMNWTEKMTFSTKVLLGLYGNHASYRGIQEITNAVFAESVLSTDVFIQQDLDRSRFAPRLEVQAGASYEIHPNLTMGITYRFDGFWEVSNIDHPKVIMEGNAAPFAFIDHPVRIGSEDLYQHFIEFEVAWKF